MQNLLYYYLLLLLILLSYIFKILIKIYNNKKLSNQLFEIINIYGYLFKTFYLKKIIIFF